MHKIDDYTVKITGIVLEKPFKLQVATVEKVAKANDVSCSVLKGVFV